MPEVIKLKGKAADIYDYRKVDISGFIKGFTLDESKYRKDLERILRKFGRKERTNRVSDGDTVILNSKSEISRFSREGMTVIVGKGLLSEEFESQLIGMTVGTKKDISVNGEKAEVEVVSATHTLLPELTDENVAAFGMNGVTTVSGLRRYCIGKQVEAFLLEDEAPDMASAYVWREMTAKSKIIRDPGEETRARARADKKIHCLSEEGESVETDDLEKMIYNIFLTELDTAIIGCSMMERENALLTGDDYDRYINRMAEAYPDRDSDDLRQEYDAESYAVEYYADFLAKKIDEYVSDCFKAVFCV